MKSFPPFHNGRFFLSGVLVLSIFTLAVTDSLSRERRRLFSFRKNPSPRQTAFPEGQVPRALPADVEIRRAIPVDDGRAYATSTPDAQARFLAGMSPGGRSHLALRSTDYWKNHAWQMDARWDRAAVRLGRIRSWRRSVLGNIAAGRNAVFYPFGGPDFLYAHAFFPEAKTYFLCGLEPVGSIPNLDAMRDGELNLALQGLQVSIASSLDYSYFITKDMRRDLNQTPLRGVLPVLYVYIARTGHRIQSVEQVNLGSGGKVSAAGAGGNGVRIRCSSSRGGTRTVYYFRTDLSNGGGSRFHQLMAANGPGVTFLKSASYLLHSGGFSKTRDAIQRYSDAILQDPSGIPYRHFRDGSWRINLHGNYVGTLDMFRNYYQPDLREAYATHRSLPLSFGVGYKFDPATSSLLLARKVR